MSTFRVSKDKENPYIMINKKTLQNENLSWKARGLLAYLLSLPDDWKVYEKELISHTTDGKDSTRSAIQELIKAGYIIRTRQHNSEGKFAGYEYKILETIENSTVVGKSENGKTENGKSATTNNDITNNELTNYNNDNGALENARCVFENQEIIKAISEYMNDLYKQKTGKKHPYLKEEQYKRVYIEIEDNMSEWGYDYESLLDMMCQFLNSNIDTDYNINHFATSGILTNRKYEIGA